MPRKPNDSPFYRNNSRLLKAGAKVPRTPDQAMEVARCMADPVYFAENYVKIIHTERGVIPFIPYDYQREMIEDMNAFRYNVFCCSRQSGKSITVVSFLLWFILFQSDKEPKKVGILANKQATAHEILNRLRISYQNIPIWMQAGIVTFNKGTVELDNGSVILASATSSDNIRGHSLNIVYIDECAFVEHWDEFFASVLPTISSGKESKIIMTSTPNGLNHFYGYINEAKKGKNQYHWKEVPWQRVPGRDEAWAKNALEELNNDQQKFDQEYNIQYLGSTGSLIGLWKLRDLATATQLPYFNKNNVYKYEDVIEGHKYVLSADVSEGKLLDYSAFSIIDVTQLPYKQVLVYRSNEIVPSDYTDIIHQVAKHYNEALVLVETNVLGAQICETLYYGHEYINVVQTQTKGQQEKQVSEGYGGAKTDFGIRTTKKVKNLGCSLLKLLVENDSLLISDENTVFELSTFVKKNNSYEAEEGQHDDLAMGLVLFAWLTDQSFFTEFVDMSVFANIREHTLEQLMDQLELTGYLDDGSEESDKYLLDGPDF
jgi:hypothetical protein